MKVLHAGWGRAAVPFMDSKLRSCHFYEFWCFFWAQNPRQYPAPLFKYLQAPA